MFVAESVADPSNLVARDRMLLISASVAGLPVAALRYIAPFAMSNCLRVVRCALLTATFLLLSFVPTCSQQIQLEVANAVVTQNFVGDAAISITLSPESRRAFAAFSKDVAGRFIEIRSAGDVLANVRLQTSIEGGVLQFVLRDGNATEVARKLSENTTRLEIKVLEEKR